MTTLPDSSAQQKEPDPAASAVHLCLLLGRILFSFGATTQRVQDSIVCLARYLGCEVEILVSHDALLITVNQGPTFRTRIDAAHGIAGLNLLGLVQVSGFLRGLSHSQPSPADVEEELCLIRDTPLLHGVVAQTLAAGCAGAGFCIVNGGDPASWAGSFIAAAFIFAIRRPLAAWKFNFHLTLFTIALAGSLLASLLARLTQTATPAVALVAPVLFLVPGSFLINGGIDVVRNHVTVGIARVGFTVAALVALCLGVGLTVRLLPVQVSPPFSMPGNWQIVVVSVASALAAAALACLSNGGPFLMALCAVGGLIGRLVRALVTLGGLDLITATLIGVLCSSLVVTFIAERLRWPAVVACVMAALPMVPGYFAVAGLHALLLFAGANDPDSAQVSVALQALARALFISIALVVGVIGPVVILQRAKERV